MRRLLISLFLLSLVSGVYSQTPVWEWAKPIYTDGHEISHDVVVDQASNSVYMVGQWANSLSLFFPTGTNPCEDFSAPFGQRDGYVAKFDQDGNLIWAFKLGGPGNDFVDEIVVDGSGNIYITGYIGAGSGDVYLAGTSPISGASTINNISDNDFFVAKYNSDGEFIWLQRSETDLGSIEGEDLAINSSGVFVSGTHESTCTIGSLSISQTFGGNDIFVAKFDIDGNEEWIFVAGSDDNDIAEGIVADENNIYLGGFFSGTQIELNRIDGVTISTIPNTFNGWEDGLIFSYDSDGNFRWAGNISTSYRALSYDIAHDNDSIYITGAAEGDISFPSYAGNPITSSAKEDIFIASLAKSNGNTGWVHLLPCTDTGDEEGNSITLNGSGEVLVTGAFRDDLQFPEGVTLTAISGEDVFVAKYSPTGAFVWAQQAGSTQVDKGYGISTGSGGNIYISGRYDGTGTFGLLPELPDAGSNNAFIAKLSEPCTDAIGGTATASITDLCEGETITITLSVYSGAIQWQSSPAGDDAWIDIPGETNPVLSLTPVPDTTDYRAYLTAGSCNPDSSNIITITTYEVPVADPGPGGEVCGLSIGLQANPSAGTGLWSQTSGPGTISFTPSASDPIVTATGTLYGSYELKWTETNGVCSDAASITIIYTDNPLSDAGTNNEICISDGSYPISGTTSANGDILWTTSGDGTFSDPAIDNPVYTIGSETVSVTLTKTVTSPGSCTPAVDFMTLTITPEPSVDAGPNDEICLSDGTYTIDFSSSANGDILWTTSGDGIFSDPAIDNPVYTIGSETGSVTLTKTVTSPGSCTDATDFMILTLTPLPTSDAGPNSEICIGDGSYQILGTSSSGGTILWTTSGNGSFSDPGVDNPLYTLGSESGSVTLTKTVTSTGSCSDAVDFMTLSLTPLPTANAGANAEICIGDGSFTFLGTSSSNGTILWTTSGNGSFDDPGTDNPTYNLGSETGSVTLTKTVTSPGSCTDAVDFMTLTLTLAPVSDAGDGGEECDLDYELIAIPSVGTGTWTMTSGSGSATFSPNENSPLATVTVSEYGSKKFAWTEVNGSCNDSDTINVSFHEQPTANAGSGGIECDLNFELGAIPSIGTGRWVKTSGPGTTTFSPSDTDPLATLSVSEYGSYEITWIEQNGPCSPSMTITILFLQQPEANAGNGGEECDLNFQFQATPSGGSGAWSLTSGPGIATFDPSNLDPLATTTVSAFGTYEFTWTETDGICSNSNSIIVTFFEPPVANAIAPVEVCGYTADLTATLSTGSGTWSLESGPGNVNFANPVNIGSNVVTVEEYGTYTFIWNEMNGPCSNSITITIIFLETPEINAGSDAEVCGLTYEMQATAGPGSGIWTSTSGLTGFTFNPSETDPKAIVTAPDYGKYDFIWQETNGVCFGEGTVSITFYENPVAYAGPDQILDFVFSASLEADIPDYGEGRWSVISGSGTIIDSLDPMSDVINLSLGENEFMWTIKAGVCDEVSDRVKIQVNDLETPTVITPNNDGLNDYLIFKGIEYQSSSELLIYNRWGIEIYRSIDYQNDWNGKDQKMRDLIPDTYYYILKLSEDRIIKGFIEIRRE